MALAMVVAIAWLGPRPTRAGAATSPSDLGELWSELPAHTHAAVQLGSPKAARESWQAFVRAHTLGPIAEQLSAPRLTAREAFGFDVLAPDEVSGAGLDASRPLLLFAAGAADPAAPARGFSGRPRSLGAAALLLAHVADANRATAFARAWAQGEASDAPLVCTATDGATVCGAPGHDRFATAGSLLWLAPRGAAADALPSVLAARAHGQTLLAEPAFRRPRRPLAAGQATAVAFARHGAPARCRASAPLGSLWSVHLGAEGVDAKGQLLGRIEADCLSHPLSHSRPPPAPPLGPPEPWLQLTAASLPQAWQLLARVAARIDAVATHAGRGPAGPRCSDWLSLAGWPAPWPTELTADPPEPGGLGPGELRVAGLGPLLRWLGRARGPAGPGPASHAAARGPSRLPGGRGAVRGGQAGPWRLVSNDAALLAAALRQHAARSASQEPASPRPKASEPSDATGASRPEPPISPPLLRFALDARALAGAYERAVAAHAQEGLLGGLLGGWLAFTPWLPSGPVGDWLDDAAHLGRLEATVWREQDQLVWHLQQRPWRL